MVAGIERLRRAKERLAGNAVDRQEFLRAASDYWSATIDAPAWPPELRSRSESLNRSLLLYGPIKDTIAHMTDRELSRVRAELLSVIALAESLHAG